MGARARGSRARAGARGGTRRPCRGRDLSGAAGSRTSADGRRTRLTRDFERFKRGLPPDVAAHARDAYGVDLTARYLGETIAHPIGKGSGQLSLNQDQLETDEHAGLAFAVLKTVVAEDENGVRSMAAWAMHETRMRVERRVARSGRLGWTVTWKGRGWDRSLEEYLALVRVGRDLTRSGAMLVVPSVKYHLPYRDEAFREGEYRHTTAELAGAWGEAPLLVEQDFSPTLAGDPLAGEREQILRWLRETPNRIRAGAPLATRVALKLMNACFDDDFQVEMFRAAGDADALVVWNRLFDTRRGVAYGGWDLSDRNLRVLDRCLGVPPAPRHLTGTGNVCSGRMVLEYARRGCESVQLHTFFQLPLGEYPATRGSRTSRALHALLLDPVDGLIAAMLDLEGAGALAPRDGTLHFLDIASDAHRAR